MYFVFGVGAMVILGLTFPCFGGTKIEQKVHVYSGGIRTNYDHLWFVDDGKFTLKVSSSQSEVSYLFNGRNLYVCAKINESILKGLGIQNNKHKTLLEDLKGGTCQVVPNDFLVRFFLSPVSALSSLDFSGGLGLTIAVDQYTSKYSGRDDREKGEKCKIVDRTYKIVQKTGEKVVGEESFKEEFCLMKTPSWRHQLWRELSKQLMMQPSARQLFVDLKEDSEQWPGFPLKLTVKFEKEYQNKLVRHGTLDLKTVGLSEVAIDLRQWQLPADYKVIDLSQLGRSDISSKTNISIDDLIKQDPVPRIIYHILKGGL